MNGEKDGREGQELFFALDIGTRSLIGSVGCIQGEKVRVLAVETLAHSKRAMIDGQIEDIAEVARLAAQVREQLQSRLECSLERVYVAAAGRALRTQRASFELEFPGRTRIGKEEVSRLEAGAIASAEEEFSRQEPERQFYLVGYSIVQYELDHYPMSSLLDHSGKSAGVEIIATFLPAEVVESLYTAMQKAGLTVAGMTLEPIAAINLAIPEKLRLLNLVMVDIGAGTSDIAACRDGSVTGYTMATVAGDEITEAIMREYLLDFDTAERVKEALGEKERVTFRDILGMEHAVSAEEVLDRVQASVEALCAQIGDRVLEANGGKPSALFLAGGGSRLKGLREGIAARLQMEENKVAVAGGFYHMQCVCDDADIADPEYATPLGILVSAALGLIRDNCRILLNGIPARLFGNGSLTVRDVLMMNGYTYRDMVGRAGRNLTVLVNGERRVFHGAPAEPAALSVNGQEASLSDRVSAGDRITFRPAVQGTDASVTAAQAARIPEEAQVRINGKTCPGATPLRAGDALEADAPAPVSVSASQIRPSREEAGKEPPQEKDVLRQTSGELWFRLNGRKLRLPPKPGGLPYYMLDMLPLTGMDYRSLKNPVTIRVNGQEAGFRQPLKQGDAIEIREVPSPGVPDGMSSGR